MDGQVTKYGKSELLEHYKRVKTDKFALHKEAIGKMIKDFITSGKDEVDIVAKEEYYHDQPIWRFYIDDREHPFNQVLRLGVISLHGSPFPKSTAGESITVGDHMICVSDKTEFIIFMRCNYCESTSYRPGQNYCTYPLVNYLKNDLDLMVTATGTPRQLSQTGHQSRGVKITISWKHWIKDSGK